MVNSVTAIMEYAMPLVDDLLTDMEKYLWYCSLDAASGFFAHDQRRGQVHAHEGAKYASPHHDRGWKYNLGGEAVAPKSRQRKSIYYYYSSKLDFDSPLVCSLFNGATSSHWESQGVKDEEVPPGEHSYLTVTGIALSQVTHLKR
ncbi:unnamed protein product [Phytophthora fragariaefolia]|uniref:Unnamed protein product n=1 Tax=Phytophthora fragariaefolia TaxID=1490495 RepID=A0A9W6Y7E8_9STRA|nr:unnamed protein product [Phytophthora fragariaefolia]